MVRPRTRKSNPEPSVLAVLESLAPRRLAAEWDNVGWLVVPHPWLCRRVLVTVDLTPSVLDEARRSQCNLVISYHPPIFRPIKRLKATRADAEDLAAEALVHNIAVYSPHTAWDAAQGGTNDTIAALCGARNLRPFNFATGLSAESKIVVFVPPAQLDRVAEAMFAAGAGRIGQYTHCSFRIPGHGTFFGTESTNPRLGHRGRLERVDEIRLEAVAKNSDIPAVVSAIRDAHPYEEPAFDIYPLGAIPSAKVGQGRMGTLQNRTNLRQLAAMLKRKTLAANIAIVGDPKRRIERVFICVGAAGSLPFEAEYPVCGPGDCVITGEIRHHDALRYLRCGASAIALGHWASERPGVAELARRLKAALHRLDVRLSRADRDPFSPA